MRLVAGLGFVHLLAALFFVERNRLVLLLLAELLDLLAHVVEVLVGGHAGGGIFQQITEIRLHQVELVEVGAFDGVTFERMFERAFADVLRVIPDGGQDDVGQDALQLRGDAAGAVKLLHRDLERAAVFFRLVQPDVVRDVVHALHGAFAVRGNVAHDQGPAVILQRRRHDLGSRGAEAAGQHDQRPVVERRGIGVGRHDDAAVVSLHLDDGAFLDEQASEADGFFERAAAVVTQVENDAADVFGLEFFQQLGHVHRRVFTGGIPAGPGGRPHRRVEGRQVDHAQPFGFARAARQFDDLALGGGFGQRDFIADQADDGARGGIVFGNDGELHLGAFRPADHLHGLVQVHFDDVHRRLAALRHGHDAVAGLELFVLGGGAAGHEPGDLAVTVVEPEFRADAEEREVHADGELVQSLLVEIIRVRIIDVRQGREVFAQHVLVVPVGKHAEAALVAVRERLDDLFVDGLGGLDGIRGRRIFLGVLKSKFHLQIFIAQILPPDFFGLVRILRVGQILAAGGDALVGLEFKLLVLQQVGRVGHALLQPCDEH